MLRLSKFNFLLLLLPFSLFAQNQAKGYYIQAVNGATNNHYVAIYQQLINSSLKQNTQNPAVIFTITLAKVDEKPNKTLIDGNCELSVEFAILKEGKANKISEIRHQAQYQRSQNMKQEERVNDIFKRFFEQDIVYLNQWFDKNKAKSEVLATGSSVTILPPYQMNDIDTVYYGTRVINWNDFKRSPKMQNPYGAMIYTSIAFEAKFGVNNGKVFAQIKPKVFMVKSQSWAKAEATSQYALLHEQLHFDIAQVAMNRFLKKIKTLTDLTNYDDLSSRIQYEYLESFKEMNRLQEQYDGESNHSLITEKQAEWAEKVKNWLKE